MKRSTTTDRCARDETGWCAAACCVSSAHTTALGLSCFGRLGTAAAETPTPRCDRAIASSCAPRCVFDRASEPPTRSRHGVATEFSRCALSLSHRGAVVARGARIEKTIHVHENVCTYVIVTATQSRAAQRANAAKHTY